MKYTKEQLFLLDVKWGFTVKIYYRFHSNTKFHPEVTHGINYGVVIKMFCFKN
jgi:hypothetical protein